MEKKLTIAIIGASGYLGGLTSKHLESEDYEIIKISRSKKGKGWRKWGDGCLDGADVVINFAGKSVDCRWDDEVKKELLESRTKSSKQVVEWMSAMDESARPQLYLCASGVGIYGDRGSDVLTEEDSIFDQNEKQKNHRDRDYLSVICEHWEASANQAKDLGVRVVSMRIGAVLGEDSKAWEKMSLPYRMFVGGKLGDGSAYFSWIHDRDVVRAIQHCIETKELEGGVNFCATSLTHGQLAKTIGKVLKRPSFLCVPEFAMKLAVGEFAESLLASINAVPGKLDKTGYKFSFRQIQPALVEIES